MIRITLVLAAFAALVLPALALQPSPPHNLQFVVTSDAHYGITRPAFRGQKDVNAHIVNAALVAALNTVPGLRFPLDGGLGAGRSVGAMDFMVETGDVTNREENNSGQTVQDAATSWSQFVSDYLDGLKLKSRTGARIPILIVPGNHEASNAVGFYRTMSPATDATPLVEIFNRMLAPPKPRTTSTYDYQADRVFFTRDFAGIHFVFLHVWPDSAMRARLERDLQLVNRSTPVILFAHDQPDVEAKHFINPNGAHDVNATDRFENLLADQFADGTSIDAPTTIEQAQFEAFLAHHPNITAYFHGNSNWHQAYEWNGPHSTARLHAFRVDSPMKGAVSSLDETRLSFEVVTIDPAQRTMTVRECLWNTNPAAPAAPAAWGDAATVTLEPRPGSASARPAQ